jgi:hypothetical protein
MAGRCRRVKDSVESAKAHASVCQAADEPDQCLHPIPEMIQLPYDQHITRTQGGKAGRQARLLIG